MGADLALPAAVATLDPAPPQLLEARRLQRRFDRKYLVSVTQVMGLIAALRDSHGVLLAADQRLALYRTTYFDTASRRAFHDHRRGRPRRAKIRTRTYVDRGLSVLEVKQRTGRGTTDKSRLVREPDQRSLGRTEQAWLRERVPWAEHIGPVAANDFLRLTLLGTDEVERITLDVGVNFAAHSRSISLVNTAVVEIKTPTRGQPSAAVRWLHRQGLRPTSFSKYCAGSVMLDRELPDNTFRPALRLVRRLEAA